MIGGQPVLYVEDDPVDALILQRAFARCGIENPLRVARNGEEALQLLAPSNSAALPGLVLLDLNMPVMNGFELLGSLKTDPRLRHIPAVVLSSSRREADRRQSYELGVAGFIEKPIGFEAFVDAVATFARYWTLCELP